MRVDLNYCRMMGDWRVDCENCDVPIPLASVPTDHRLGDEGAGWVHGTIYCRRCADDAREERDQCDPFEWFERTRELSL